MIISFPWPQISLIPMFMWSFKYLISYQLGDVSYNGSSSSRGWGKSISFVRIHWPLNTAIGSLFTPALLFFTKFVDLLKITLSNLYLVSCIVQTSNYDQCTQIHIMKEKRLGWMEQIDLLWKNASGFQTFEGSDLDALIIFYRTKQSIFFLYFFYLPFVCTKAGFFFPNLSYSFMYSLKKVM